MTQRRRVGLWWTDAPSAARLGAFLVALFIALSAAAILFGCTSLSQPSAGLDLITQPENICDANPRHFPGCVIGFGVWIRAHF